MKVLIIEDELLAVQRLVSMLKKIDRDIEIVATLESVENSIYYLRHSDRVDLIFMDVELSDGNSFEIFDNVPVNAPVIFITAFQEHALDAFKHNSIAYLLKPLNQEDLETALLKYHRLQAIAKENLKKDITHYLSINNATVPTRERFLARSGAKLLSVPVEDIAFFYTKDKQQFITTYNASEYAFDKCLDEIETDLNAKQFYRVNRQFIVNYDAIANVYTWFSGRLKVETKPNSGAEIIVSRLKAIEFKRWLGE